MKISPFEHESYFLLLVPHKAPPILKVDQFRMTKIFYETKIKILIFKELIQNMEEMISINVVDSDETLMEKTKRI